MQNTNTNAVAPTRHIETKVINIEEVCITESSTIVPVALWLLLIGAVILILGAPYN